MAKSAVEFISSATVSIGDAAAEAGEEWKNILMRLKQDPSLRPTTCVSLTGGIGNQLFQIAAGLAFSSHSHLVLIANLGSPNLSNEGKIASSELLSPTFFYDSHREEFSVFQKKYHNLLLRTTRKSELKISNSLTRFIHKIVANSSALILKRGQNIVAPFDSGFEEIYQNPQMSSFLIGYFQSPDFWDSDMQDKLRKIFKLQETSPELESLRDISSFERPLVVHIRLGDYSQYSEFGILAPEYYKTSIAFHWKTGKYRKIWVFTNSPDSVEPYLPSEFRENFRFINIHQGNAAHNLEAMRLGYGYIISNSTYSWWGAYLSNNHNALVVAPDVWFKTLPEPKSLIPGGWIRMKASHE